MNKLSASFAMTLDALEAAGEITRLRLLALLADAELTVSELMTILGQSQPRISRHLRLLVEAGGGVATPVCADPMPAMYDFLPGMDR